MRILVVSNGFPPRGRFGTEFYTGELVRGLAARGHTVAVLHPERSGARSRYSVEEVEEGGIPVFLVHNPGDPRKRFEPSYHDARVEACFDEVLARFQPEAVHFLYLLWGLSVGLPAVARARGIASLLTVTDYGLVCHRGQMFDQRLTRCGGPHEPATCARCIREPAPHDHRPATLLAKRAAVRTLAAWGGLGRVVVTRDLVARERAVARALDGVARIVVPTVSLGRAFLRKGVPEEKLVPLVYAFDEAPYAAVRSLPEPAPPRLGFLGQFAPHKGLGTLLEAVRRVEARRVQPFELVLHGSGAVGRHALYAERVLGTNPPRSLRLGEPFGPQDAPRILAGFRAVVVPSEWDENAPLTVLQARAAGRWVVGSDVPGIAEVVEPGRHGRLVPPGDPEALAVALVEALEGARPKDSGLPLSLADHLSKIEELLSSLAGPNR